MSDATLPPPIANPAVPVQVLCPGNVPLVLLPVRLETRFFRLDTGQTELRVRIYPDKIHIDTHQPELTTDERTSGTQYWQQDWVCGNDATARGDAWRTLASRFGAARAAWIIRVLQPTNIGQRPIAPVPAGQTPPVAPVFPTLSAVGAGGESAWRHPPQARLLPDRWTAIVHSAGQVALSVTGRNIPRPLAAGPDPLAPPPDAATEAAIQAGDRLAVDPGMAWMLDFEAAEAVGMGLRLTVPPAILAAGIDSLVVFGVAASLSLNDTANQLADLLDAHHYTDGLEFLRLGTLTNNTDDRRAGYTSDDPGHSRSFANEVLAIPSRAPNAARVGIALGLPAARIAPTLGHLGQAAQDHDLDMRSMNLALWQVSWGYFLTNLVGAETGLKVGSVDWARRYFRDYVRSGGPLPTLRCGSQPYGILPVTSLDFWSPGPTEAVAPEEIWLKGVLLRMRESVWRPVASQVAHVGRRQAPPDPDADLADVMQTEAISHGLLTRSVLGRHYLEHLYCLAAQDFNAVAQQQNVTSGRLLGLLNLPSDAAHAPHAAHAFFASAARPVTAPLVQSGEVSPWRLLQPNYIQAMLLQKQIQALVDASPAPSATDHATSMLQTLLRHAMLRELANATAQIAATLPGNDLTKLLRDLELVDLVDAPLTDHTLHTPPPTLHWRRQLELVVPGVTGTQTIRQFLEGLTTFTSPPVSALGEFRLGLSHLQLLDSEALQCLMLGTLDLAAHRLDAWITSYATKRLALMTAHGPVAPRVGAFGWVEQLVPAAAAAQVPSAAIPPGEQAPLFAPAGDSGFIHAPSATQAAAAAILRNAHLGATGIPSADGAFAIELSSRRVRAARRLLQGVQQGQPPGALLGYQFERNLHELKLDAFIAPLRNVAPLVVRARESNASPAEALAANNVVDGLVLVRRWQDPADTSVTQALQGATDLQRQKITSELTALQDAIDGLGDALMAEVAHQMARGNAFRMATTLASIATGEAPPPELEVARIPRSGNTITHRVLVLTNAALQPGAGWADPASSIRAATEPVLNAWVSGLLGDARTIRCTIERLDDASGAVTQTMHFALSELSLTPLDIVYGVDVAPTTSQSSPPLSPIEQRVLSWARTRPGGFGTAPRLRLQHARPADLSTGQMTLLDALQQARAVRAVLERSRGIRPDDIAPPGMPAAATLDLDSLETRVKAAEDRLTASHGRLAALMSQAPPAAADDLRTALLDLGQYGLEPSLPNIALGDSPEIRDALLRQAAALLSGSAARLKASSDLRAQVAAPDPRVRCDQLLERSRAVFGGAFVMLASFTCDARSATELRTALAASTTQQGGDALAVHGWFTRSARVREPLARLNDCLRGAEVLGCGDRLSLQVAQLPFDQTESWVGLPPRTGSALAASKLSMIVHAAHTLDTTQPMAGLLADEWVEVVPSPTETSALTFQFDPPNSFAPQSVLIAVPPVPGADWTTESLRRVVVETLDLAKLRGIDSSLLGATTQYLPALYLAFNPSDDAVSTDLTSFTN